MKTIHVIKTVVRMADDLDDVNDLEMRSLVKIQLERGNVLECLETEWQGVIRTEKNELSLEGESK
jgi:hypothetical protein